MMHPDLSEARRLLGIGLKLVQLQPYTKMPVGHEWNKHPVTEINPEATGYGLILAQNKLCSLDPDNWPLAKRGMAALGFDLEELMRTGVRTTSTRPGSGGRSTFAAEGDLEWIKFRSKSTGTVIEFRAASANLQDCVPGLIYKDKTGRMCQQQYANGKRLDDAPPLPDRLLAWWERCSMEIEYLHAQERKFFAALETAPQHSLSTGKGTALAYPAPHHRTAYNAAHTVEELLERHGYSYDRRLQRWAPPTATGEPGVRPIPNKDGLWRSDHASDPLSGTFDAWIAHVVLDHDGDLAAARKSAEAEGLIFDVGSITDEDAPKAEPAGALVLRPLHEIVAEQREPEWLLDDVIEAKVLAVLAGPRGTFKSFVALDWSMRIAATGQPVVILSGEGAGLDRRADAWIRTHGGGRAVEEFPVFALERALNLNADTDMVLLREAVKRLGRLPALVVVDTFSKFSAGLDENDNGEVSTYLARLSEYIRQAFGSTVLLVAHSGHSDSSRPRGASALMANPDAEYVIARPAPGSMSVSVSRERFKDCPALPALWYDAQVIDLGRTDKRGQPVTSLALVPGVPVTSASAGGGKNTERALVALREFHRQNPEVRFLTSEDMKGMFAAQGLDRKRRPEVLNWLVNAGILTNSIGGHSFDPTNL